MLTTSTVDAGRHIDWGLSANDYGRYRPGPPDSLFEKLRAHGVGLPGQRVLDLGTGTGVIARRLARQGCTVTGVDISAEQIAMARSLAGADGLEADFHVAAAETFECSPGSYDVVTASQCFLYFDKQKVIPRIKEALIHGGIFVTSHFSWLPLRDPIAKASEELILKHNPSWSAHSYSGVVAPNHSGLEKSFCLKSFFWYDENIPFTRESWCGRIRACRGIGPALSADAVQCFDAEHRAMLCAKAPELFEIVHRIDAHLYSKEDSD